jgi:SagB-type dehydrogenase family enzyme
MRTPVRRLNYTLVAYIAWFGFSGPLPVRADDPVSNPAPRAAVVQLPQPRLTGTASVEAALAARRSSRFYSDRPLTIDDLSQLLWAAQGITHPRGLRTAPSAGALYPLELTVIAGMVSDLPAGTYRYQPAGHRLILIAEGDERAALADAALGQSPVRKAPVVIAIAADYRKTMIKYGERGVRYVHLEAGHAAQNLCLQATALGLGTVVLGAFSDQGVAAVLRNSGQQPLCLIPVGRK